jgi:membrane-associated protease RseP (regulator of RpoE activity)
VVIDRFSTAARFCVVAGTLSGALAPLSATQQPAPEGRGWLGISVNQHYECLWETTENWKTCDLVMHIEGVQDGGPSALGGLQPGDRVIALDGRDVTFASWAGLFGSVRPGRPVTIDVMRGGARHFAQVVPARRTAETESGTWTRRQVAREPSRPRGSFVVTLTEIEPSEGSGALAITIRDTEDARVAVEPAAIRVVEGQLRVTPLNESVFVELPELRRELLGDLRGVTDSSYERATSALQVMERIRERIPSEAFLEQLSRVAQVGLREVRLATRVGRTFAGAEFEVANRTLATAMNASRAGLLVIEVAPRTPAARLGLRAGDLVFEADGRDLREVADLARVVEDAREPVVVRWVRNGTEMRGRFP